MRGVGKAVVMVVTARVGLVMILSVPLLFLLRLLLLFLLLLVLLLVLLMMKMMILRMPDVSGAVRGGRGVVQEDLGTASMLVLVLALA